jgi:hypothetical protein
LGRNGILADTVAVVLFPDVMIMGGDCRLFFHSMARLLPSDESLLPACDLQCRPLPEQQVSFKRIFSSTRCTTTATDGMETGSTMVDRSLSFSLDQDEQQALAKFLSAHRINISLRQVYPD